MVKLLRESADVRDHRVKDRKIRLLSTEANAAHDLQHAVQHCSECEMLSLNDADCLHAVGPKCNVLERYYRAARDLAQSRMTRRLDHPDGDPDRCDYLPQPARPPIQSARCSLRKNDP